NGWQFAAALFVGLLVMGTYGPGDLRRDMRRLFLACALATALPLWMRIWTRGLEPVLVQYVLTTVLVWLGLVAERLTVDRIAASGAQVVVVCGYVTDKEFQGIVDTALAAGCQVLSVPRTVDIAGVHPTTVWRRGQPLVQLTAPSLKGWQLAVKRVVDVIGAA